MTKQHQKASLFTGLDGIQCKTCTSLSIHSTLCDHVTST